MHPVAAECISRSAFTTCLETERPCTVKKFLSLAATLALAGAGLLTASPASAATSGCAGTLSKKTVLGHLSGPAGKVCTLNGSRVYGNITLGKGAALRVKGGELSGNVAATNSPWDVKFERTTVRGNVSVSSAR